ncbi:MAG: hypothetical protein EP329_02325 [Deltaproteobacteria bacterium]|nr:MAG: hypothetical protein EP329_02325 [Deltaproteobacteria bacterium]
MSTGRSASRSVALTALLTALAAAPASAAPCPTALAGCADEACAIRYARCALDAEADPVAATRAAQKAWPDSGPLAVLVAAAYLKVDNPVWALRTLLYRVIDAPEDCGATVWLAWVKLRLGRADEATAVLADDLCIGRDATGTRALLVRAAAAHKSGAVDAATAALDEARRQPLIDASDVTALDALSRAVEPNRLRAVAWRFEPAAGYATNPLLGAPNDPEVARATDGSGFLQLDAWMRFAPDLGSTVRPFVEAQPRVVRYLGAAAEELSTVTLSGRAGVLVGRGFPRVTLGWRPDYVLIELGDTYAPGPLWYYGAHRAELELEVSPRLLLLAGGGRRDFRELGRSRWEVDLGAGGGLQLVRPVALVWAVTGRSHTAQDEAYDLLGATALFSLDVRLPASLWARANGGLGLDWYARSAGAFGIADERRDVAVRAGAQLGVTVASAMRVGLGWEMTWRDSTVPDYVATDHRLVLRVSWAREADVAGPTPVDEALAAPLGWGFDAADGAAGERVQDLLRRDEQVRPGCGCGL